jgi:hypothetical protein
LGIDRGLAQPFAARLYCKRRGFCIVPLDRNLRQLSIELWASTAARWKISVSSRRERDGEAAGD